jgi:hypothetical protein
LTQLDPRFVDVSIERWQRVTGGMALHADSGQPFSRSAGYTARRRTPCPPSRLPAHGRSSRPVGRPPQSRRCSPRTQRSPKRVTGAAAPSISGNSSSCSRLPPPSSRLLWSLPRRKLEPIISLADAAPGAATVQSRGHSACQQDGPHCLGIVGQWRALPGAAACGSVTRGLPKGG